MNVYIYNSALYCEDCGKALREQLTTAGKAPADPNDETTYDSQYFPKGPEANVGWCGDSPDHCASMETCVNACDTGTPYPDGWGKVGCLLENPLTKDGIEYVRERVLAEYHHETDEWGNPVTKMWWDYYSDRYDIKLPVSESE